MANKKQSLFQDAFIRFKKDKVAVFSLFVIVAILVACFVVPWFYPDNYFSHIDLYSTTQAPSFEHFFGTDAIGRDVFVRVLVGGQISFEVAIVATIVSVVIGTLWGAFAGFIGGKIDGFMMRIVDALYALPFLFFAILLVTLFGRNFILIFVAIGVVSWLDVARVVRGQTIALRHKEFVEAAKVSGLTNRKIVTKHIIRNLIGIIIVYITLTIPTVLMLSAFLSFLGLGVQPPMTDWGEMISDGASYITMGYWWLLVYPSAFLTITLLALNFVGNAMRQALDPKSKR
ncbi:ABC transporter permease [Francisella tularensis subsp. novicida]|uniref:Oligopeptide transport system permease protein OppC n=3 Tax=Francisella tularensis TaxID=263 RepID=A0A6I4RVT6_FRATU|nr:ABC transporter permease [Francisella tularensis]ABK90451.1 peptide/opine/nickel uptake transporter (PepT) family protein [Francisella tularensis subsp. novicida U112]AJI44588.1 binding--dependent transport system inner membrane component family protein [Francisella tularensis subsp. novicida F6168]AJI61427.1 binding--dependent transport system inner membrane component family protein [Francisella tularensis subsp. novicida U112]AJJ46738.1 binding--dependent transport system inner membrane co